MSIHAYDIAKSATEFANTMLIDKMKNDNEFSYSNLEKIIEHIFATKFAHDYTINVALGSIISYHNQLREKLIADFNIDIGEINA